MRNPTRRRLLVGLAAVAGGVMARTAGAQPRLVKIGVLTESWGPTPAVVGLREGLKALGYREDEHFTIGVRFTEGNLAALPGAARDLVRQGPDIIVTTGADNVGRAAQAATDRVPIVFVGGSDPIGLGLVQSFARPGGNITGIADLDTQLAPKRLELFHDLIPGLKRVLLPYDATNPQAADHLLGVHRGAARRQGLVLVEKPLRTESEARAALAGVRKGDADGIVSPRFVSLNIPGFILEVAARGVLPTMFHDPFFVERGGLASYSTSYHDLGRQAARLVDRIMKGTKPADLPVEQPTKFEFALNLKSAKALGLTVPPALLLRVDRTVE